MKKFLALSLAGASAFSGFCEETYMPSTSITPDATGFFSDVSSVVTNLQPLILSIAGAALGLLMISIIWHAVRKFLAGGGK